MPLRKSGRGRSACTMRAFMSVVGPSSMSTGSYPRPTASAGEWVVLDDVLAEIRIPEADHAGYL